MCCSHFRLRTFESRSIERQDRLGPGLGRRYGSVAWLAQHAIRDIRRRSSVVGMPCNLAGCRSCILTQGIAMDALRQTIVGLSRTGQTSDPHGYHVA